MKKFFSLVLALTMALSMASFASAEETTTIHIGVIGPMTGAAAVYGLAVARGAEIAVEEINAAGKVNIVLDVQDDENDAEKSINAYNATLDKGTQVILGCVTTTPCIAVSAQAYDERVFMLTPSASSLEVIANKDNAYQVCFTDPAQGSASAEYIFNKKVGKYQEKYGEVPNQFAADAYDGIYALAAAAEKAGVKGDEAAEDICDAMIAAMQELTVTGLTGTMVWDATGAVTKTPTAVIIKNGVYVGAEAAAAE